MLSLLSDNWRLVLSMVLALLIGWNIRVPVFKMAILKNFVDKPNKRSSHTGCVPNIGGIVVFLAFLCSFLLFVRFDSRPEFQYVLLGAILIFLVGIGTTCIQSSRTSRRRRASSGPQRTFASVCSAGQETARNTSGGSAARAEPLDGNCTLLWGSAGAEAQCRFTDRTPA